MSVCGSDRGIYDGFGFRILLVELFVLFEFHPFGVYVYGAFLVYLGRSETSGTFFIRVPAHKDVTFLYGIFRVIELTTVSCFYGFVVLAAASVEYDFVFLFPDTFSHDENDEREN